MSLITISIYFYLSILIINYEKFKFEDIKIFKKN